MEVLPVRREWSTGRNVEITFALCHFDVSIHTATLLPVITQLSNKLIILTLFDLQHILNGPAAHFIRSLHVITCVAAPKDMSTGMTTKVTRRQHHSSFRSSFLWAVLLLFQKCLN